MTANVSLFDRVNSLCADVRESFTDEAVVSRVDEIRDTLNGPLRIALAGRVKAGKSTLLNALVGERLAATDEGECTRIVTIYRYGLSYDVQAVMVDGSRQALAFDRTEGELTFLPPTGDTDAIRHIEVQWPASSLRPLTLIDTPGIGSQADDSEQRTTEFLGISGGEVPEADAIVYLMRHFHFSDAEFLNGFHDYLREGDSPVHAVGVLSRADEIGLAVSMR